MLTISLYRESDSVCKEGTGKSKPKLGSKASKKAQSQLIGEFSACLFISNSHIQLKSQVDRMAKG
ncbi:unnamed protein product [Protopolystoma xenopodis]|uniref:Uncharacterized protein n=1 Tax=Protopolystoma xenopodis TaxID=117903 RepID=A0A448X419_9PLAT|nr:unnamed protein product [Protopolystoma xenopodis]